MRDIVVLVVLSLAFVGCGDSPDTPPTQAPDPMPMPEPEPTPDPEPDPSALFVEALYDPLQIVDLRIEIPEEDWDALRHEARSIDAIIGPGCDASPSPSVTEYRPATVSINGEQAEDVGVKNKGFLGSINPLRPSLKVKWNAFEDKDLHGITHMTFNNNNQDPSALHTCLAFHMFAKAGIPSPRCNLARVHVNGRDMGIYSHAEPIRKPFLARHFDDNDGPLFEGALSDFIPGRAVTFERKTQKGRDDLDEIEAVIDALESDDDTLIESLEAVLDLDQFLRFWSMEVMTSHWDGYNGNTNNFYLYQDPTTEKLVFLPHGTDGAFQTGGSNRVSRVVFADSALSSRLLRHPEGKQRFLAAFRETHEAVWDLNTLLAMVDDWSALVDLPAGVPGAANFEEEVENLRIFLRSYNGALNQLLARDDLPDAEPYRTEPRCFVDGGAFDLSFQTTWGTLETEDMFRTGFGDFAIDAAFIELDVDSLGASVGPTGEEAGDRVVLNTIAPVAPGQFLFLRLVTTPFQVSTGQDIRFKEVSSLGQMFFIDGEAFNFLGFVTDGTLSLDESGFEVGDTWSGNFNGTILVPPGLVD